MRITKEQEQVLNEFVCQRLSADPRNEQLIRQFTCRRNPMLAAYLKCRGWEEDISGAATFYVIKDKQDRVLFYFSLKCGALFEPLDIEGLWQRVNTHQRILDSIRKYRRRKATEEEMAEVQQKMVEYSMSISMLELTLRSEMEEMRSKIHDYKQDQQQESNPMIARVVKTYPAVELVQFCGNDGNRQYWNKLKHRYGFPPDSTLGQVLFWKFVAPILSGIHKTLGCQYVYLFAADDSLDSRLVNYYEVSLNFKKDSGLGTSKPRYDFTCPFLCQSIEDLRKFRCYYFDHFNAAPEDVYA